MESERKVMLKEQFFHLRFKGDPMEQKCERPEEDGGNFIAVHEVLPRGGATIFYCPSEESGKSMLGISLCSDTDTFGKKDGRVKASGDLDKKFRAQSAVAGVYGPIPFSEKVKCSKILDEAGEWSFDKMLTSQEAIKAGKEIIYLKVRRILERRLAEWDKERVRITEFGDKYLSGDLKLKANKRRKTKPQEA